MEEDFLMFKAKIELTQSNREIEKRIIQECAKYLKSKLSKSNQVLIVSIKTLLRNAVESQPEYIGLVSGDLQNELGVEDPENKLKAIIDLWLESVSSFFRVSMVNNKLFGVFEIQLHKAVYASLLTLPEAVQQYTSKTNPNGTIPWLEWLLVNGDVVLARYQYRTTPADIMEEYSRTGMGLMFKNKGKIWRMPEEYEPGSVENNFLTRAISSVSNKIDDLIQAKLIEILS